MSETGGRAYLELAVAERATHESAEAVRVTCSFARAERLLGREYHGRFLIELLQNAADAWRNDPRRHDDADRCRVAVVITEGPALLVANQGAPLTAQVVIDSLGHIGASTKPEGEAIGHKGIGFKSVLELSLAPEIYSGWPSADRVAPDLAAAFDPERALEIIRAHTRGPGDEQWEDLVADVDGLDPNDPLAGVPVLRFPHWVDAPPAEVLDLASQGFDTVVRLPFRAGHAERLGLDRSAWLTTVRTAIDELTDQIIVLLGCFADVSIDDRLRRKRSVIVPDWHGARRRLASGADHEQVTVRRNGGSSSTWHLYRQELPDQGDLAGEIAVGVRVDPAPAVSPPRALAAVDGDPSAPFHLFFPTRIPSGLPFLLHGYFEVDAARTGFYRGSTARNTEILDDLARLTAEAVDDVATVDAVDLVSLADLIAAAAEPAEPLARAFRAQVLDELDDVAWIPLQAADRAPARARPTETIAATPALNRRIGDVFGPAYVQEVLDLGVPHPALSDAAMELVARRRPAGDEHRFDTWQAVAELCRPGDRPGGDGTPLWEGNDADRGFLGLVDLLDALDVVDRNATQQLVAGLRGDRAARLLPTVTAGAGRALLPVPDPGEGQAGNRSLLVMARVRAAGADDLVPPAALDVAFLPDGLLSNEQEVDRAKPLGVRPFTVDNVLDRLKGIAASGVDPAALLDFLWRLLVRERLSAFGTHRCADRATTFDPAHWAWCRPGRAREDDNARLRQQRERYLADVPVPCRDDAWRPAGEVAFGADWADWIDQGLFGPSTPALVDRAAAYRANDAVAPGPGALLASPEMLQALLPEEAFEPAGFVIEGDHEELDPTAAGVVDETDLPRRRRAERHAFLLRLGVAEVPPLESWETRDPARAPFPWDGDLAARQQKVCQSDGRWAFGFEDWSGEQHHNVRLGEDFRFRWDLDAMAAKDVGALVAALRLGAGLYGQRLHAAVFCTGCGDSGSHHKAWRDSTPDDGYPSWLALQLESGHWVPASLNGSPVDPPLRPGDAWWHHHPPTGAGLQQSPWRLVPVCGPVHGVTDDLRRLGGIRAFDDATPRDVGALLARLRSQFEDGALAVDPASSGSARQALIGIHRLAYDRLADLAADHPDDVAVVLDEHGVLCELGDELTYRSPVEARHDDGTAAAYVRHFLGVVPFAVLSRDREAVAKRLGIPALEVTVTRVGDHDPGRDVTAETRPFLGDRVAELLSIVVHHSLGSQTLEATSSQFEERARRLKALTVRQLDDLVVTATEARTGYAVTIGEGADQDLYLDGPTSAAPVLYHDLNGPGWEDRLRRRIAPHLATLLENPAYHHTFALFLQADGDAEREEFLLDLGIGGDEVDAIARIIGAVTEHEQQRHRRWFSSLARLAGGGVADDDAPPSLDGDELVPWLVAAGYPDEVARALVEAGGGEDVRQDGGEGRPLALLDGLGLSLAALDEDLRRRGDGLALRVSRRRFRQWVDTHGHRLAVVLARSGHYDDQGARAAVQPLSAPPELALALDPPTEALLRPVLDVLGRAGRATEPGVLVATPAEELARLAGCDDVATLDAAVVALYDEEERKRILRARAGEWRHELRLLGVLRATGPHDTRAAIRGHLDEIEAQLPVNPAAPSQLLTPSGKVLGGHLHLTRLLEDGLVDRITADPPDRDALLTAAAADGIAIDRLDRVLLVLEAPARTRGRELHERSQRLADEKVAPSRPPELGPMPPRPPKPPSPDPKPVPKVKVEPSHDRRKRALGDEGEQWALASVLRPLLALDVAARAEAIDEVVALLGGFEGRPVEEALAHEARAREADLDPEELADELAGLLHVARHSDAFGFDLLGWFPSPAEPGSEAGTPVGAVCLEVKSSGGEGFHLSAGEWATAERFHAEERGDRYAVLVVRRSASGGVPAAMDLLADPVQLLADEQLRRDVDGYVISYSTG